MGYSKLPELTHRAGQLLRISSSANESTQISSLATHPMLLFGILFFQIYGPKLFGSSVFDLISISSVLAICLVLLVFPNRLEWLYESSKIVTLLYLLIVYSLLVTLFSTHQELFYPLKFFRSLLNFLGGCALYQLYYMRYTNSTVYKVVEQIFVAIAIHGMLMVVQYTNEDFARFLYAVAGDDRIKLTRVSGLTISYNTLSLVQGFGLLLGVIYYRQLSYRYGNVLFAIFLSVIFASMLLAGRTAMYIMLIFSLTALTGKTTSFRPAWLIQFLVMGIIIYFTALILRSLFISEELARRFEIYTWNYLYEPLESYFKHRNFSDTYGGQTIENIAQNMYFFPDNLNTLIWGSSLSGRGQIYISSDVGYVLFIFGIGLTGTILVLIVYMYTLIESLKWLKYDSWLTFLTMVFVTGVLIVHFKEQTLLTRHAFTISSLLFASTTTTKRVFSDV